MLAPIRVFGIPLLFLVCGGGARADDAEPSAEMPPDEPSAEMPPDEPSAEMPPDEPSAKERPWFDALCPEDVTVTAGALFPAFLIYEMPGPWAGVEVGWRLSHSAKLVANAGMGAVWATGTQRYLFPMGLSLRVLPWDVGPWFQFGLGATPYIEHIGVVLPERTVSVTDFGATMTLNIKVGGSAWGWDLGLGYEHNLLPTFYEKYTGDEALPWTGTVMVWIGKQVWSRRQP